MRILGLILAVMVLIMSALAFDIIDNAYVVYFSIGIISLCIIANLVVSTARKYRNSSDIYPNFIETYQTKRLVDYFKGEGIDMRIYSYVDNKLNASLLPSSCITIALSQGLLSAFNEKECISIIYHELGHYDYRQYHINDVISGLNNVIFLSLCFGVLFICKVCCGTSIWGILIIPLLGFILVRLYSLLNKRLFMIEEFYADKYSYLKTGERILWVFIIK